MKTRTIAKIGKDRWGTRAVIFTDGSHIRVETAKADALQVGQEINPADYRPIGVRGQVNDLSRDEVFALIDGAGLADEETATLDDDGLRELLVNLVNDGAILLVD